MQQGAMKETFTSRAIGRNAGQGRSSPAEAARSRKATLAAAPARPRLAALLLGTAPLLAAFLLSLLLMSCAPTTIKHGHHFRASDLNQVQEGMSKEQVTQILGTPDTTSPINGGEGYYYISSIKKQSSFFKPDEVDRKVLAVYFNKLESVDKIAQYGLKDGKVFDFINRETPTHARDEGILKSLFRNLGKKQGIF